MARWDSIQRANCMLILPKSKCQHALKTMLYLMPFGIVFDFFVTMRDVDRPYSLPDRFTGTMVVRR